MLDLDETARNAAKAAAGKAAAECVQHGMIVGLGTGSTASFFIQHLIKRQREEGLRITAVATSERSLELAKKGGIPIADIKTITSIDFTADGADEIDASLRMIKGGGGALMREKIIASSSKEWVAIVDNQKFVKQLGSFPLPLEILPFAYRATETKIEKLGFSGSFRTNTKGDLYLTDNGNYIFDIRFATPPKNIESINEDFLHIPGILETGFFLNLANRVIIGYPDGRTEIRT